MTTNSANHRYCLAATGSLAVWLLGVLILLFANGAVAQTSATLSMCRIKVVDQQTSRGIPRVRLKTTNDLEFWTDSAGVTAFYHPDLMDKSVYFSLEAYGYTFPRDASGCAGLAVRTTAGTTVTIAMHRQYAAQRLYRITGEGIYQDSALLGDTVPPTQDPSASPVMGQDSVGTAIYKGKLYWHWGDTGIPRYPLGSYGTTCATSDLPGSGGLDPDVGVYLTYFRKSNGEVRAMTNISGVVWIGAMRVIQDGAGADHLVANFSQGAFNVTQRGLINFNNATKTFERLTTFPLTQVVPLGGHNYFYLDGGTTYSYSGAPAPTTRVSSDYVSIQNPANYEAFTCLKLGSAYDANSSQPLERDAQGQLVWGWKGNTAPLGPDQVINYTNKAYMADDENFYRLTETSSGKRLFAHGADTCWNDYRQRWISVYTQLWLTVPDSFLGELIYAEADTPLGPWMYSEKIVSHKLPDKTYSWYNPHFHKEFEKDGGRVVFFEGTYTSWLSSTDIETPAYNYNQDMYKLELDDPRVMLPVAVYRTSETLPAYWTKTALPTPGVPRDIVFFAPDRQRPGTIPVYEYRDPAHNTMVLSVDPGLAPPYQPGTTAFYAYNRSDDSPSSRSQGIYPLNEFVSATTQKRIYTTDTTVPVPDFTMSPDPVCLVWKSQSRFQPQKMN